MLASIIFIDFHKIFHSWFYFQIQFNSAKDKHVRPVYSLQGTSSDPACLQPVLHTTEGLILLKDSAENATLSRLLLKQYFSLRCCLYTCSYVFTSSSQLSQFLEHVHSCIH